jgi:hypothetical protein
VTAQTLLFLSIGPLLLAANLLMIELGYRYRRASPLRAASGAELAMGPEATTVLSLMALVLAFTFSNAAARLDAARDTILAEVNSIETAWRRIDLAEPEARPRLRVLLRDYVDARLDAYRALPDERAYLRQVARGSDLLEQLWLASVKNRSEGPDRMLLLSAVNTVGDAAGARKLSLGTHLSVIVLVFLFGIVLLGSMLIGTALAGLQGRQWLHRLTTATVLAAVVVAILDMEYPRTAFNLLSRADAMLVDLRKTMR